MARAGADLLFHLSPEQHVASDEKLSPSVADRKKGFALLLVAASLAYGDPRALLSGQHAGKWRPQPTTRTLREV